MASKYVRGYLLQGLDTTPVVMDRLLAGIREEDIDWTPDAGRFTIREAVAHLADWEGVWLERIKRIQAEDNPVLLSYDESQWAIDHDYAHSDFHAECKKFRDGRAALSAYLSEISDTEWPREGIREGLGAVSIFDLCTLVLGHDSYHLRQVTEYRGAREA